MTLEGRVQALLDLVEGDRARRCEAISRDAQARASDVRSTARAAALQRLRTAFAEERERRESRIAAARARLQTHRRLHDQRRAAALLATGWQRLPEALCERWRDPPSRQAWVTRVLNEACAALGTSPWRIVHASLPEHERDRIASSLEHERGALAEWVGDGALRAGLKVSAAGNVIDGTLDGLLADRTDIGARLLRHMEDA